MRAITMSSVGLVLATALAAAQQPPSPQEPTTPPTPEVTFKVEVNYVEEDVRVVDREGRFVRGLKREDFQVLEDGKPQKVETFGMVDIPNTRPRTPLYLGPDALPIEPDVAVNKQVLDGRLYLLVLDDYHVAPLRSQNVRNIARRFVREKLGPDDQAAVVVTSGLRRASQDFTQNRRLLIEAIDNFLGQKLPSAGVERNEKMSREMNAAGAPIDDAGDPIQIDPANRYIADDRVSERTFQARQALNSLRSISEWMSSIQGRRKAIIYISEGVDYNLFDIFTGGDPTNFNFENFNMIQTETYDTIAAASRSNVQIYSVDPRGLTSMGQEDIEIGGLAAGAYNLGPKQLLQELQSSQMNLRQLSEETGGVAFVGRNDFNEGFDRIVEENSQYYVLGYYSTNDKRDGKLRNIGVRVAGYPDAQVTYRKRYAAPRGRGPKNTAAGKPLDPTKSLSADLVNTMTSPLPKTGIQLRVSAIAKKGVGKTTDVEVLIDTLGRDLTFTDKNGTFVNKLSMQVGVFNKEGKSIFAERPDVDLNLRPESHVRVTQNGVRILRHLSLPPGRYQLRVAAQDSGKVKQGSAHLDIDVPDFSKESLAISNVAIASTADRSVYSPPKPGFDPFNGLLPGSPSALRQFPNDSEFATAVEVYINKPTPVHTFDVTTVVRADDGRVVFNRSVERSTDDLHGTPGGFGFTERIPIQNWTPGLYVLQIDAKSRLNDIAPASRVIQFEVR
ncbi:MAG TPA: VWA domain-containing protein [Vicinamibacterales bacterium]|nr:VWA domain-containing protein [Vicinamibacterales bacterium]